MVREITITHMLRLRGVLVSFGGGADTNVATYYLHNIVKLYLATSLTLLVKSCLQATFSSCLEQGLGVFLVDASGET